MDKHILRAARLAILLCLPLFGAEAQTDEDAKSSDNIWTKVAPESQEGVESRLRRSGRSASSEATALFELDGGQLRQRLERAPAEGEGVATRSSRAAAPGDVIITVPKPDGAYQQFRVEETQLLAPELAAKFPEIKSYRGDSVDGPPASLSLQVTPKGFFGQIRTDTETIIINPLPQDERPNLHESLKRSDAARRRSSFAARRGENDLGAQCLTLGSAPLRRERRGGRPEPISFGGAVRIYRIAVAATGEFTQAYGGTPALALSAIAITIGRISQVYSEELSIRFQIVPGNEKIIFTDPSADPFTNNNSGALMDESQAEIDKTIGDANYDIGHTFATAQGGVVSGRAGVTGQKARAMTGQGRPEGDPFDIDFVAHEIGHQLDGNHTYNAPSCSEDQRVPETAYEPVSGTTIMAYTGICDESDNLQKNSHPYFLFSSLEEIANYASTANGQPGAIAVGNTPPTVKVKNLPSSGEFVVPKGTAFRLDAEGTDPDGDELYYTWEQEDLGEPQALMDADDGKSPLFRSIAPDKVSSRDFPRLDDTLNGVKSPGERLPEKARTMTFRVTARDKRRVGGGFAGARASVKMVTVAGPFRVRAPRSNERVSQNIAVKWDVAKTAEAPVGTKFVNILLSEDGGRTFTRTLRRNSPNDGQESIRVPDGVSGPSMRIRVEAAGGIFYAISPGNFSIAPNRRVVGPVSRAVR